MIAPTSSSPSNPLLFERSTGPFDLSLWRNPSSEYRGAPFWSWNNKLRPEQLLRQLDFMQEMGMGGAHMHPRTGLDTPYMGEEYMGIMRTIVDRCKEKGMLACLYDEDRWPSGAAGGMISKINPDFRQMHLLVSVYPYGELPEHLKPKQVSKGASERSENGVLLARYDVVVSPSGLASYRRLAEDDTSAPQGTIWYFYAEYQPPAPWWNFGTYVDTLNPKALELFLKITHEKYAQAFGADFGKTIPSIFTDEPQFTAKEYLPDSTAVKDLFFPWTPDLPETFQAKYGKDILDTLPEIIWDTGDDSTPSTPSTPSLARYQFHDHVCDRFVEAFVDQVADWCREKGINLTGHMNGEPRLQTQTAYLGDAMRCYRNFDLPGIDMLCDEKEYNTAKQASSVARQNGVRGLMSELYGVTNWTFDFKGHKGQGDWQAALGVTFRVPHLFPVSMAGEAKRDYPAAIGYQSPWTTEYSYLETHFARVNVALTRGRPVTRVAVIHPVESFWLSWGPADRNGSEQVWREKAFADLSEWLLHGLVDFDFISESLFEGQTSLEEITGKTLPVGQCRYEAVIVANLRTIRSSTLNRLNKFAENGGKVIITGGIPSLVDVKPTSIKLPANAKQVPFTAWDVLSAIDDQRDIKITSDGHATHSLMYQMRVDGQDRFLFVCDTERYDPIDTTIRVQGKWDVTVLDTLAGDEWIVQSKVDNDANGDGDGDGWTSWDWTFYASTSLLVRLQPRKDGDGAERVKGLKRPSYQDDYNEQSRCVVKGVTLDEPNVLLLDQAQWRLEGDCEQDWQPRMEVLHIDNIIRGKLGLPLKKDAFPQPWNATPEQRTPKTTLHLRFTFESDVDLPTSQLAVENTEGTVVRLDGEEVSRDKVGWFTDEDIPVITLGPISRGTHTLDLAIAFGLTTAVERIYVLGDFGVNLYGDRGVLTTLDKSRITWGDFTRQGLPFYVGNITYHAAFTLPKPNPVVLQTYQFAGPAVTATFKSKKYHLSLPPHVADLGELPAGEHKVDFKLFGNRENAFGALHMPPGETNWWGPNAWRGDQNYWMDEYDVKPMGITIAPAVQVPGKRMYGVPMRRRH